MSKRFRTAYGWAGGGPDTEEQVRGKKAMKLLRSGDYMGTFHDAIATIKKGEAAKTAAKTSAKHKKIQAQVNKHLVKAEGHRSTARAAHLRGDSIERSVTAGHKERQAAEVLRKQLPQGYAMVFGKLRKITAGKPRTGIAKLKR